MERKGKHEDRIEEVKRALAVVQQMQAEIVRRSLREDRFRQHAVGLN